MEEWDMLGGDVLFISSQDFTMELAWDELDKEKPITVYPRDTTDEHIEVLCNADFNPPIRLVRGSADKNIDAYLGLVLDANSKSLLRIKSAAECTQCKSPMLAVSDEDIPACKPDKGVILRPRILCPHTNRVKYRLVVAIRNRTATTQQQNPIKRGIFTSPFSLTVVDKLPEKPPSKPHPLSVAFKEILSNPQFADVTFVVEERNVPAHKVILCARSEYFRTLLGGHMLEASQPHPVIPIVDISYEMFSAMLAYVYTDHIEIDSEQVLSILSTADRFRLEELKNRCEKYLESSLDLDVTNVCSILQIADMHSCISLKMKCLAFICEHLDEIERSTYYKEMFAELLPIYSQLYEDRISKIISEGESPHVPRNEKAKNKPLPPTLKKTDDVKLGAINTPSPQSKFIRVSMNNTPPAKTKLRSLRNTATSTTTTSTATTQPQLKPLNNHLSALAANLETDKQMLDDDTSEDDHKDEDEYLLKDDDDDDMPSLFKRDSYTSLHSSTDLELPNTNDTSNNNNNNSNTSNMDNQNPTHLSKYLTKPNSLLPRRWSGYNFFNNSNAGNNAQNDDANLLPSNNNADNLANDPINYGNLLADDYLIGSLEIPSPPFAEPSIPPNDDYPVLPIVNLQADNSNANNNSAVNNTVFNTNNLVPFSMASSPKAKTSTTTTSTTTTTTSNGNHSPPKPSPKKATEFALDKDKGFRKFSGACSLRLRNDIKEFLLRPIHNIRMNWTAGGGSLTVSVKIVNDSVFGEGWYYFRLNFTNDFPMAPPSVQFVSKMFHPNVFSNGEARVHLLQPENWCATSSVSTIVSTIRHNLFVAAPREDLLANLYAWHVYNTSPTRYREIVRDFSRVGGNKRSNSDMNMDSVKKQRLTEDDFDTEELYVSDQSFWMWGDEKDREP